jgi:glycosyltransferase involved in cell wall biosynthesis
MGKANPDRMNGVNKVVCQLASQQVSAGMDVQVWGFANDLTVNYPKRSFTTTLFPTPKLFASIDPVFLDALNVLNPTETIFHLHGGWILPLFKAARALKKAGLRYVITGHGAYNTVAMQRSKWKKKAYFQFFEKSLLKNAAAIHCIGASEVTGVQAIFPTDRTILVPYGMEFNEPVALSIPPSEQFIFGFVGRLDYQTKGLDLMLEGFANHFRNDYSAVLWIIGNGEGRSAVTAKIDQLGIADNVILWGAKYGSEKDALIQQMNVFLHPSRNEGLPCSVLEASALGVPCIVTEATNVGSYISQHRAGFVVPNNNAKELGLVMAHCSQTNASNLERMGKNAAQMVVQQFNWSYLVKQFNQLYA